MTSAPDERRHSNLRAALGFLQLKPTEPDLQLLHRWLDTWEGVDLPSSLWAWSVRATGSR